MQYDKNSNLIRKGGIPIAAISTLYLVSFYSFLQLVIVGVPNLTRISKL